MGMKQIQHDLIEAMNAASPKTSPYDTEAEVVRVEGGTAWVHIPGGVDETPVAMTINASAGDTVRVRVGNGTAWLVGNDTAPPTDDHTAIIASRQAAQAAAIARKTVELTEDLNQRIANANGLYETRITQSGATITYMHNKPNLADSDIQMMISDVGVLVTANGTDASPTWYGLTVDGNLIANILQANGINADWINTGALVIYDNNNSEIFRADKSGKIFRWNMTHSQMTADGDITLRRTYDSSQGGDSSAPAFSSQKTDIIHNYDTVMAVKKNVSDVKYGEDIFMKHSTYLYGTEADYSSDSPDLSMYDSVSLSPSGLVFSTYSSDPYTPDDNPIEIIPGDGSSTRPYILLEKESLSRRAFTRIAQNANLNSYTKPGNYYVLDSDASTISNSPWTSYNYQLLVFSYFGDDMTLQIAWRDSVHETMKFRLRNSNGTWGSWRSLSSETGYKTGKITIPTGTSATATASINFSDVVPTGRTVYGVSLRLVSGSSSYLIPYVNSSGNVVTWISQLTDSAVTLSNKTTAWSNYTYYLAVFFH